MKSKEINSIPTSSNGEFNNNMRKEVRVISWGPMMSSFFWTVVNLNKKPKDLQAINSVKASSNLKIITAIKYTYSDVYERIGQTW